MSTCYLLKYLISKKNKNKKSIKGEIMKEILSERMMALITIYTTKVTSMEETVQNCIHYNYIISELYTKMNFIRRLETNQRTQSPEYLQIFNFINSLEIETNKIIQEELLIKQLSEDSRTIDETNLSNTTSNSSNLNGHIQNNNAHLNGNIDKKREIDPDIDASKPKSSEKIVFETSKNEVIEIDISMADIIKSCTIISDLDKKDKKDKK